MTIQRVDLGLTDTGAGCACCATSNTTAEDAPATEGVSTTLLVDGMTCGHCVASVTEELSAVPGVDSVSVDLHAGGTSTVTVRSAAAVDAAVLSAAVGEAGYAVSGTSA